MTSPYPWSLLLHLPWESEPTLIDHPAFDLHETFTDDQRAELAQEALIVLHPVLAWKDLLHVEWLYVTLQREFPDRQQVELRWHFQYGQCIHWDHGKDS